MFHQIYILEGSFAVCVKKIALDRIKYVVDKMEALFKMADAREY